MSVSQNPRIRLGPRVGPKANSVPPWMILKDLARKLIQWRRQLGLKPCPGCRRLRDVSDFGSKPSRNSARAHYNARYCIACRQKNLRLSEEVNSPRLDEWADAWEQTSQWRGNYQDAARQPESPGTGPTALRRSGSAAAAVNRDLKSEPSARPGRQGAGRGETKACSESSAPA